MDVGDIAQAQAAEDAALLAEKLAARDAEVWKKLMDEAKVVDMDPDLSDILEPIATPAEALRPINRAERRAMVAQFKANLRLLPRALPERNDTIIPKSKRRRKKS